MNKEVKDDGGPAFPWGEHGTVLGGMTLRDYFASKAMQTLLNKHEVVSLLTIVEQSYRVADAMLKAREL